MKLYPLVIGGCALVTVLVAFVFSTFDITPEEKRSKQSYEYLSKPSIPSSFPLPDELTADFQLTHGWWIANGPVRDSNLSALLQKEPNPQKLRLACSDISAKGFSLLKERKVRVLNLTDTTIPPESCAAISEIAALQYLEVRRCLPLDPLRYLTGPRWLKCLTSDRSHTSNETVKVISKHLKNLAYLSLHNEKQIDDGVVEYLGAYPKLDTLDLSGTSITPDGIARILEKIPLFALYLADLGITDRFVRDHVVKSGVAFLDISANPITDQSLSYLVSMKGLHRLYLVRCPNVSDASVKRFRKQRPDCEIVNKEAKSEHQWPILLTPPLADTTSSSVRHH